MSTPPRYTFGAAITDPAILEKNLAASPFLVANIGHEIIVQRGAESAAIAYNRILDNASNDVVILVHQDVYFPGGCLSVMCRSLELLTALDPNWGVAGCVGMTSSGEGFGRIYSTGLGVVGQRCSAPVPVKALDEIVLIVRKSSGLRFDESLPHFHFYGADICMAALDRGMKPCVIPSFCIHNTDQLLVLPAEFYQCYNHIRRRWQRYLPIHTTCVTISKYGMPVRMRKVNELYLRLSGKNAKRQRRIDDPKTLLKQPDIDREIRHYTHPSWSGNFAHAS